MNDLVCSDRETPTDWQDFLDIYLILTYPPEQMPFQLSIQTRGLSL